MPFPYPSLEVNLDALRGSLEGRQDELRNPHPETKVSHERKATAVDSAVLIPLVCRSGELFVVFTRRHPNLRFAGQLCFPGGHQDGNDRDPVHTALRESHEEIGLMPDQVEVLGSMGDYFTQTGYRIVPVVGLVNETVLFRANPAEVDAIYEVPMARILRADAYQVNWHHRHRGHIAFHHRFADGESIRIAGPTVSVMINLYEHLLMSAGILDVPFELAQQH